MMDEKAIQEKNQKYGTKEKRIERTKKLIEWIFFKGGEKIRTMMRSFIQIFPAKPVKLGDSWEGGIDIEALQGYEANLKNTLKNHEKDKAIIDSVYKRSLDDKPIKHKDNPKSILTKIDYKGTTQIDKYSGWIIRKEAKVSFSTEFRHQKGITTPISVNVVKVN